MTDKVYLIGEEHFDLFKAFRYFNAIRRFKPDVISLEMSKKLSSEGKELENLYGQRINNPINFVALSSLVGQGPELGVYLYRKRFHKELKISYSDPLQDRVVQNLKEVKSKILSDRSFEFISLDKKVREESLLITDGILSRALNRFIQILRGEINIPKELIKLVIRDEAQEIYKAESWLDCFYLYNRQELDRYLDFDHILEVNEVQERDAIMLESILTQKGVVLHQGGWTHFYDSRYKNLYESLKEKKVPVERFKLIEFCNKNVLLSYLYQRLVQKRLKRIKKLVGKGG